MKNEFFNRIENMESLTVNALIALHKEYNIPKNKLKWEEQGEWIGSKLVIIKGKEETATFLLTLSIANIDVFKCVYIFNPEYVWKI